MLLGAHWPATRPRRFSQRPPPRLGGVFSAVGSHSLASQSQAARSPRWRRHFTLGLNQDVVRQAVSASLRLLAERDADDSLAVRSLPERQGFQKQNLPRYREFPDTPFTALRLDSLRHPDLGLIDCAMSGKAVRRSHSICLTALEPQRGSP